MMPLSSRIYVGGHRGLVGSAIVRALCRAGYHNLLLRTHTELDLTDQAAVYRFFDDERPQYVFLAAAKVGGIQANRTRPSDFLLENLQIQANIIGNARHFQVERLLFLGSSCIYPKFAAQPIREESLLCGPLEPTNQAYAVAKIAGIEMCRASNRQHGTHFLAAMPCNLYGPGDNYDRDSSHVIPALLQKLHAAKLVGETEVELWGSGTPRREFLYSDDLATACLQLMELHPQAFDVLITDPVAPALINVGSGEDLTIADLAALIAEVTGFTGKIRFDASQPDGTPRKLLDASRMRALDWMPETNLRDGLARAYRDFLSRCDVPELPPVEALVNS
ncbi:MAG TPA: GDP-L-fucose synthase [Terriglobales bacterium]|jgi:GDP-L-fucose synthase|nr:GDP-L-fucose synthase [Terriglobales bacterium]